MTLTIQLNADDKSGIRKSQNYQTGQNYQFSDITKLSD